MVGLRVCEERIMSSTKRIDCYHHHLNARAGIPSQMGGPTFEQFAGHYLAFLQSKNLKTWIDLTRSSKNIWFRFLVRFLLCRCSCIMDCSSSNMPIPTGCGVTIERECTVLLGMLTMRWPRRSLTRIACHCCRSLMERGVNGWLSRENCGEFSQ
jgi:hypothetical protein